jgi:hypothetical protein
LSFKTTEIEPVQPFASVAVTLYIPAVSPFMLAPFAPVLHTKLYGATPPVALTVIAPFCAPQSALVVVEEIVIVEVTTLMVTDWIVVQPFASVAVTLTTPAADTVMEGVFAPVDHE